MFSLIATAWSFVFLAAQTLASTPIGSPEMVPIDTPLSRAGFERIHRDQGVTVYKHKKADVIHIAAEGRMAGSPAQVRRVLLDYKRHPGRIDRVSKSLIIKRWANRLLVYQRLNLPVITDRDFNLAVSWGDADGLLWIHYRTSLHGAPPQPGVVRVHYHRGSWQLKPERGGQTTWARYQTSIDLAGLLPRWMARSSVGDEVPGLFVAIRRMLVEAPPKAGP